MLAHGCTFAMRRRGTSKQKEGHLSCVHIPQRDNCTTHMRLIKQAINYSTSLFVGLSYAVFRPLIEATYISECNWNEYAGVRYGAAAGPGSEGSEQKLRLALELIEKVDHRRFISLVSRLKRVMVAPSPAASYWPRSNACVLNANIVAERSVAMLACYILHEAVHARIHQAGVPYSKRLRRRIERRCTIEEIAFARRLPLSDWPNVHALLAHYSSRLAEYEA